MAKALRVIGFLFYFLMAIFLIGWYVEWLDQFMPYILACALGVITIPLGPFALIFDLIKNGLSQDFIFMVSFLGCGLFFNGFAYFIEEKGK